MKPLKFWKINERDVIVIASIIGEKKEKNTNTLKGWYIWSGWLLIPPILIEFIVALL